MLMHVVMQFFLLSGLKSQILSVVIANFYLFTYYLIDGPRLKFLLKRFMTKNSSILSFDSPLLKKCGYGRSSSTALKKFYKMVYWLETTVFVLYKKLHANTPRYEMRVPFIK